MILCLWDWNSIRLGLNHLLSTKRIGNLSFILPHMQFLYSEKKTWSELLIFCIDSCFYNNRRMPNETDMHPNEDWIPWQYYSASCRDTYGYLLKLPNMIFVNKDVESEIQEHLFFTLFVFKHFVYQNWEVIPFHNQIILI